MMSVAEASVLSEKQMQQFQQDGYFIARGLLNSAQVAEIRETFMTMAKDGPVQGLSEFRHGGREAYTSTDPLARYPRMMHPHRHPDKPVGPVARKYMLYPAIGAILAELIGEEALAVQSMFYFKPAGARGQDLHQDNFYLRVAPGSCMAAWIAIDDADPENGGMVVVPGTQDMAIVCPEKSDPAKFFTTEHVNPPAGKREVPAVLKAGDVLFFNGSVIHGSYPNTSKDRFRRALICHYVPASSTALSAGYLEPTRFSGQMVPVPPAQGGGPCGNIAAPTTPH
jgi:ectoine hydroxylase-related dioxygenase (phytanoyl-CoA dioxygenase family)